MDNSTTTELVKPADTFQDLVTDDMTMVIQVTNYVIICGIVSLFGIGANIVNICVFVRQGFKDSINISLLGLAFADFSCLVSTFWTSICDNPLFINLDLPFAAFDVMYLTGGWPHVCFTRITSFITSFITLERCLCISMPLRVKNIITPFKTKVIIVSIFVSMITLFSPFYFVNKLEWKSNNSKNRSILALTFTKDREIVDSVMFVIQSVFLSTIFLLCVAICTIILVVKLNQKTKWRESSSNQTSCKRESASVKDKKVAKMIILLSIIFMICYIPPTINFLVMACYPQYNIVGRFRNTLTVTWSVSFVLEAVNSSLNIFVYFKMSSKFKATLYEIMCVFSRKKTQ